MRPLILMLPFTGSAAAAARGLDQLCGFLEEEISKALTHSQDKALEKTL